MALVGIELETLVSEPESFLKNYYLQIRKKHFNFQRFIKNIFLQKTYQINNKK